MATATSAPPANIGKYRIERELGRGASGIVYLGLDGFRGRKVAIKQTHAHLLKVPEQAERYRKLLRNEAALSGRLRHPNIVRLLDADEEAVPPYLVLEYVDGQPLSAFATPDALLPMPQVLDIAFKCCNALDYACREGLVHRDIKPANLMLARDGDVKLTDFGAALSLRSDATQLSGLVGSPSYMSPEQVREHDLTHHSDMFSLAVVVYELLTGRRPFDGDTDFATLYKISHEAPTPPSLLRAALPPHVDEVLLRALAKDPADRFATWPDFAQALLAAHRGLPRQRSQDTEAERFARLRALPFFCRLSRCGPVGADAPGQLAPPGAGHRAHAREHPGRLVLHPHRRPDRHQPPRLEPQHPGPRRHPGRDDLPAPRQQNAHRHRRGRNRGAGAQSAQPRTARGVGGFAVSL